MRACVCAQCTFFQDSQRPSFDGAVLQDFQVLEDGDTGCEGHKILLPTAPGQAYQGLQTPHWQAQEVTCKGSGVEESGPMSVYEDTVEAIQV